MTPPALDLRSEQSKRREGLLLEAEGTHYSVRNSVVHPVDCARRVNARRTTALCDFGLRHRPPRDRTFRNSGMSPDLNKGALTFFLQRSLTEADT